ncbi:MAG: hypothetical protein ACRDTA_26265 [Pseudonocardiaceae bacterium]
MTNPTPTTGASFAHAAALLTEHLADHALPEPTLLSVTTSYGHTTLTAQLRGTTLPGIAADLLAWADTLSAVTVQVWRPPQRDQVHLSILSTLTSSPGAIELKVLGSVDYDPFRFADLQPHTHRGMPLSLGQLRIWAAHPTTTTGIPALETHRAGR